MSKVKIDAKGLEIKDLLTSTYSFVIPNFQRPYSWKKNEVKQLLEDLTRNLEDSTKVEHLSPHFLGSIVLIKNESSPLSKVIDGQQRLTTLTILLSTLRHFLSKSDLTKFIYEKGDELSGIKDHYRLTIRERDMAFFKKYIQKENAFANLLTEYQNKNIEEEDLSDSQRNIIQNALVMYEYINMLNSEQVKKLAMFLLQKCQIVVVATEDEESAFRIFSVLNDRGLQLTYADILKADIVGALEDESLQNEYTKKWEDLEESLGVESFNDLLSYIRMIAVKAKAKDSILKEIRQSLNPVATPIDFMEDVLFKYGETFFGIINENVCSNNSVNEYISLLNSIPNKDWVPAAISFLSKQSDTVMMLKFLKKLETLAFGLWVMGTYSTPRIERYAQILSEIEKPSVKGNPDLITNLSLTGQEISEITSRLEGDIYNSDFRKYLLLRLDREIADEGAVYYHKVITIEHVLPVHPKPGSEWLKNFVNVKQRQKLTNCLGNLALLSRRKNSSASNLDFNEKKAKYFNGKTTTTFALTTQIINEPEWKPITIKNRQEYLLDICKEIWEL